MTKQRLIVFLPNGQPVATAAEDFTITDDRHLFGHDEHGNMVCAFAPGGWIGTLLVQTTETVEPTRH